MFVIRHDLNNSIMNLICRNKFNGHQLGDEPGSSPRAVQKPRQALNSHITVQVPEWSKGYDSRSYDESLAGSNPALDISRSHGVVGKHIGL